MRRALAATPAAMLTFVGVMVLAALAIRTGFLPDDSVNLWAAAIAAGDGEVSIGRIVAAYPTIPFLGTTFLELITPAGTPTPALLVASVLGLICGAWLIAFLEAGLPLLFAAAAAALTAFHPAMLRVVVAGPAETFFALFFFIFAKGLFDLRARSTASEVMTVGLALLGLAFSHPMGAAICVAATPFLVLAVRPVLIANAAFNVVVALIFPTVFCIGAFSYISWVFPGNGWSFLSAPAQGLAAWAAGALHVVSFAPEGMLVVGVGFAVALSLALGSPLAAVSILWVRRRRPLVIPPLIVITASVVAAVLAVATGLFGDPGVLVVAAPVLTAAALMRVPDWRAQKLLGLALLLIGWLGGIAGLVSVDPRIGAYASDALTGARGDRDRIDALNLGAATSGHDGVLVDTYNAPAVVLGRGDARGLLGPNNEPFALTMLFGRVDADFVALPDPQSVVGARDRLNQAFPAFFHRAAPGYRLVYQNPTWRMFERIQKRQEP